MIIYRKRTIGPYSFYEYLVVCENRQLKEPLALPERYVNRTIGAYKQFYGNVFIEVSSKPFSTCEHTSSEKINKCTGIWIVADDCVEKGHYDPEQIEGKAQYFSYPIEFTTRINISAASGFLKETSPLVCYHGTAETNVESVLSTGIQFSNGMLGKGVYLGTFWKATRYACLTQDYKPQQGIVFRVFAFPKNVKELPDPQWSCSCGCYTPDSADHLNAHSGDIHLSQSHLKKDARIKNEEWLIKSPVYLQQWAKIDDSTFPGPHYEPLHRKTLIV